MASVGHLPLTPQQAHLQSVQAAQAHAYHNDLPPPKQQQQAVHHTPMPVQSPSTVSYEETEDPPTRSMAYFHLLSHQLAVYMSFVLVALVIAFSIVYDDTKQLRHDVGNNIRGVCKDISEALTTYFVLVVIAAGFAVLTWLSWFVKKWLRYLPVVCAMLFLASCGALALYNVAGTVAYGKPASSACHALGDLDATEAYYMVKGALITLWVSMGVPTLFGGLYLFWQQARDLAEDFPSERKMREASRAERELLVMPSNPARAFRYP